MRRWWRIALIGSLLLAAVGVSAYAMEQASRTVGRQADGSVVLPTGQVITPAGRQIEFPGRPSAIALHPSGKTAAFLNGTARPLVVVDVEAGTLKQQFSIPGDSSASFDGLVYSPDGAKLYASQANGAIAIANVAGDGSLTLDARVVLPQTNGNPYPGGMALSADGKTLYVTLSRNNTLGVFDLAARRLTAEIPVGNAPHGVVLVGNKAYVSNQGGRPATSGDFTVDSSGTPIVADHENGGPTTGTVSVVDLTAGKTTASIEVGIQPTSLLVHDQNLFVTNTNADTISVIDTTKDTVAKTITVEVFPGAPFGSSPNSLALVDDGTPGNQQGNAATPATRAEVGQRLFVSLGRANAIAVYRWLGASKPATLEGLIPTAGYPASIAVDPTRRQLVIANSIGVSAPDAAGTPPAKSVGRNIGSASVIPFPQPEDMQRFTKQVFANNNWNGLQGQSATAQAEHGAQGKPVAVPERVGDPSTIKHVFYVVKENRTYDQVFGDDPRGNGEPSLAIFGRQVTPNQHALATEFPLLDNLYASGRLSADGHQWVTQAYVDDYLEKFFGGTIRSYPFNGGDSLAYLPTGFLWENALRHGKTARAYGEYANLFVGPDAQFGRWVDWYRDARILAGTESGQPHVPMGAFQTHSDVPSLDRLLNRDYPPYTNAIPDQYRAEIFLKELAQYERDGNLPNLVTIQLNTDHTSGTSANFPTPRAQVADNDLALGRIVEAISHSRYWQESAIFVVEDDSQAGTDHVDGHRMNSLVISPYVRRGGVDNTFYTQIDVVRTIEQILGLPPMNRMDLAATPMRGLFTDTPDTRPFTAVPNEIPLNEMNPGSAALTGVERLWAEASEEMGFDRIDTEADENAPAVLNRAIWYGTMGFTVPYPGDERVLQPSEVSRTEVNEDDDDDD